MEQLSPPVYRPAGVLCSRLWQILPLLPSLRGSDATCFVAGDWSTAVSVVDSTHSVWAAAVDAPTLRWRVLCLDGLWLGSS